jgi:hypothetical protein
MQKTQGSTLPRGPLQRGEDQTEASMLKRYDMMALVTLDRTYFDVLK